MAEGSGNPKTSNVKVSTSNATEVTLAEFTLKAEGADMTFDQFIASTTVIAVTNGNAVDDVVQAFYLYRGSTRIAEIASTGTGGITVIDTDNLSQQLKFVLDDLENLSMGSTQTYRIVAKVKAIDASGGYASGSSIVASTSPQAYEINAKASDGKSVTERAGSVTTYVQTLYNEGIQITKVGESFTATEPQTSTATVGEFKVTLRVTNFGSNDVYIPLNATATTTITSSNAAGDGGTAGLIYNVASSSNTSVGTTTSSASLTRVSGGTELTNSVRISGGSSADFLLTITFNPNDDETLQWRVGIFSVGHTTSDATTASTRVLGTPESDFRTQYYTIQN
jgi:hypothetical protein